MNELKKRRKIIAEHKKLVEKFCEGVRDYLVIGTVLKECLGMINARNE